MGPTICALAAGLFIGQTPDVMVVPAQPACNCKSSTSSGWTTMQTRTWTKTGTYTPATGWTWRTTESEAPMDDSILTRLSERLNGMFAGRPETMTETRISEGSISEGSLTASIDGFETNGWIEDDNDFAGPVIHGSGSRSGAEPVSTNRLPAGRITTSEPPLLEVSAEAPAVTSPALTVQAVTPAPQPQAVIPVVGQAKVQANNAGKIGHADDYSVLTGKLMVENGVYLINYALPNTPDRFGGRMILNGPVEFNRYRHGDLVRVSGGVVEGRNLSSYHVEAIEKVE